MFNDDIKEVLEITDLVLLDIKHINPEKISKINEVELEPTPSLCNICLKINKPTWLRYVSRSWLYRRCRRFKKLGKICFSVQNVERVDILPFHQMAHINGKKLAENIL